MHSRLNVKIGTYFTSRLYMLMQITEFVLQFTALWSRLILCSLYLCRLRRSPTPTFCGSNTKYKRAAIIMHSLLLHCALNLGLTKRNLFFIRQSSHILFFYKVADFFQSFVFPQQSSIVEIIRPNPNLCDTLAYAWHHAGVQLNDSSGFGFELCYADEQHSTCAHEDQRRVP